MRTDLAESHPSAIARPLKKREAVRLLIVASTPASDVLRLVPVAQAARMSGFDPQIVLLPVNDAPGQDTALSRLAASGLPLFRLDAPAGRGIRHTIDQYRALRQIAGKAAPQIVHTVGLRATLLGGALAKLRRLPAVHSAGPLGHRLVHGTGGSLARRFSIAAALAFVFSNRRAQIHVVTPEDRAALTGAHVLNARRSFLSRGIGVDLDDFRPRAANENGDTSAPVIAFPPPDILGHETLKSVIAAARALKDQGRAARFVLIGGLDNERISAETQSVMQEAQNQGIVEWWELADNLAETLRRADVFCLPVNGEEPCALALLIAAAATGLPLIATDCPAFRDVIRHDLNGLLVPRGDAAALEAACRKLSGDSAFRATAGRRSREIAGAEFALDASITVALTMYEAALMPLSRLRLFVREEF